MRARVKDGDRGGGGEVEVSGESEDGRGVVAVDGGKAGPRVGGWMGAGFRPCLFRPKKLIFFFKISIVSNLTT